MAIFDLNHGLTLLEKYQFFDFLKFLFLQRKKTFFRSRISQKTFSWPILSQKKRLKNGHFFDQKHGLTPLEKCQFYDFLNFLFLQHRNAFFFVLEYRKRHFPCLYCLKRKGSKMAISRQKPWVNHFRKMSIFQLFELFVFISLKGVFRSRIS